MKKLSDKQILTRAVEKAVKNGFKGKGWLSVLEYPGGFNFKHLIIFDPDFAKAFWGEGKPKTRRQKRCYDYLTSSGSSNWKEMRKILDCDNKQISRWLNALERDGFVVKVHTKYYPTNWQFHLQTMVLKKNRIKYLGKFLDS